MAKTPARRSTSRKSPAVSRRPTSKSSAAGTGPVTLKQARALARLVVPLPKGGKAALVPASPASVGVARRKLELKQEQERRRRIKEYKATLAIMKKRGVKGLGPKAEEGAGLRPRHRPSPCRRSPKATRGSTTRCRSSAAASSRGSKTSSACRSSTWRRPATRCATCWASKERKLLIEQFTDGCPAGGAVGRAAVLRRRQRHRRQPDGAVDPGLRTPTLPAAALIHQARFDAALALVRAGYEDLIGLRDGSARTTHLVFHGYDFAIPDGRGICHLGPWLKPTFDLRGFPTQATAFAVTKILLQQFAAMLASLAAAHQKVIVHQWPGHAARRPPLVAQRAASVEGRVQDFRFALPREAEGAVPERRCCSAGEPAGCQRFGDEQAVAPQSVGHHVLAGHALEHRVAHAGAVVAAQLQPLAVGRSPGTPGAGARSSRRRRRDRSRCGLERACLDLCPRR